MGRGEGNLVLSVLGFKRHLRNSVFVWAFPPSKERWCYLFAVVVLTAKLKKMTSLRAKKVTLAMMTQVRDDGRFGMLISVRYSWTWVANTSTKFLDTFDRARLN